MCAYVDSFIRSLIHVKPAPNIIGTFVDVVGCVNLVGKFTKTRK